MLKFNKRANLDTMLIPALLFVIAIGIYISYTILDSGFTAFSSDATANSLLTNGKTMMERIGNNGFFFIAAALIIFNMLGAFLLITHPIFVLIDLFLMPFSLIVAVVMSNAWETSMHNVAVITGTFPVMDFAMLHLVWIVLIADALAAIAGYAFFKQ